MRFLRWLKHIPLAVLIGLIGIWIVSGFFSINYHSVYGLIGIGNGGVIVWFFDNSELRAVLPSWHIWPATAGWRMPLGQCGYHWERANLILCIPISGLVTIVLPLVVGVWTHFRFRLWMYFSWTALVAAQCAYFAGR